MSFNKLIDQLIKLNFIYPHLRIGQLYCNYISALIYNQTKNDVRVYNSIIIKTDPIGEPWLISNDDVAHFMRSLYANWESVVEYMNSIGIEFTNVDNFNR